MGLRKDTQQLHKKIIFGLFCALPLFFFACSTHESLLLENVKANVTDFRGMVVNEESDNPVKNAEIRIANTVIQTKTNPDGQFFLFDIPKNVIKLRIEKDGYVPFETNINLIEPEQNEKVFKLREQENVEQNDSTIIEKKLFEYKTLVEKYVDIKQKLDEAKSELLASSKKAAHHEAESTEADLLDNFIGYYVTDDPDQCFAFNTGEIQLKRRSSDENIIELESPVTFKVLNLHLGYKVSVFLNYFLAKQVRTGLIMNTNAEYYFEEIPPVSQREINEWKRNRREAFQGSLRHFLMTVASEHEPYRYGFKVYKGSSVIGSSSLGSAYSKVVDNEVFKDSYVGYSGSNFKRSLNFQGTLKVEYTRKSWGDNWGNNNNVFVGGEGYKYETSWVRLNKEQVDFSINGILFNPEDISVSGTWSVTKVCEMMPDDYNPDF